MLRSPSCAAFFISCRGYRIRFLRDFDKKREPELRTMPTKWRGRMQWWREPVYIAPHISVLERGVDFTFQDGRPVYVTSIDALRRRTEQIELGKQIVKLLGEVNEAENLYGQREEVEKERNERWLSIVPSQKGVQEIS